MTDVAPTPSTVRRWPRWKSVLLVVSLALNLLIFGAVAAQIVRHRFGPPPYLSSGHATLVSFVRTLPKDRRDALWALTEGQRAELKTAWSDVRRLRIAVRTALAAEPFERDRYKDMHARLLEAELQARRSAHVLFDRVAMELNAVERSAFAKWQPRAEKPWRRRFRDRGQDSEGGLGSESDLPAGDGKAQQTTTGTRP
jgi:uncharacterized membrane protein